MIAWTRFGFLVINALRLIPVRRRIVEAVNADQSYYQDNGWPKVAASSLVGSLFGSLVPI